MWPLLLQHLAFAPPFDRMDSGSGTQLVECRTFQTAEVALARRSLLKNVLRNFQRRDRLSDQKPTICDDLAQRLSHALKMDRSVDRVGREMAEYGLQEGGEFGRRHFAGCHRKFAVLDRAKAADVPGNRHVVGRVGEYELGALLAEQGLIGLGSGRIAANQPMAADAPDITRPGNGRAGW